jgi:homospermidine synthase
VSFDEVYCGECTSCMLEKNFKIDRIKVNILELQKKIVKQIFKSSSNREIIKHLISNDIKDT